MGNVAASGLYRPRYPAAANISATCANATAYVPALHVTTARVDIADTALNRDVSSAVIKAVNITDYGYSNRSDKISVLSHPINSYLISNNADAAAGELTSVNHDVTVFHAYVHTLRPLLVARAMRTSDRRQRGSSSL